MNIAHDEGHGFFGLAVLHRFQPEPIYTELPPAGWEIRGRNLFCK